MLLQCLQTRRCLLVLDNLETLLQAHDADGRFRAGYEDYAVLLERVAQTDAPELPAADQSGDADRAWTPGAQSARGVRLAPLGARSSRLRTALRGTRDHRQHAGATRALLQRYTGNPLALNIVAESIYELFGGQISSFLEQDTVIFSSIRDLLAEQWSRLSATEQTLLFWLAVVREAVTSEDLHAQLAADRGQNAGR